MQNIALSIPLQKVTSMHTAQNEGGIQHTADSSVSSINDSLREKGNVLQFVGIAGLHEMKV